MILYGLEKTMKTEIRIDQKLKDYPTLSLTVFPLLFIIQSTALALKDKLVYKFQQPWIPCIHRLKCCDRGDTTLVFCESHVFQLDDLGKKKKNSDILLIIQDVN